MCIRDRVTRSWLGGLDSFEAVQPFDLLADEEVVDGAAAALGGDLPVQPHLHVFGGAVEMLRRPRGDAALRFRAADARTDSHGDHQPEQRGADCLLYTS